MAPPRPQQGDDICDDVIDAMEGADPELDPVWGLIAAGCGGGAQGGCDDDGRAHASASGDVAEIEFEEPFEGEKLDQPQAESSTGCSALSEDPASDSECATGTSLSQRPTASLVVDKDEVPASHFVLPPDEPRTITRWDVEGCDAFVLDGVLSVEECASLIGQAEGLWSFWDNAENPRVAFRNAHTIEVTHTELAERIWRRVGHLVKPCMTFAEEDEAFEVDIEGTWRPYAMNANMLFGRYLNGGHFSPHTDGTTVVDFNRRTLFSCILFLNESPWGGHTRIYSDEQIGKTLKEDEGGRLTGDPSLVLGAVPPKTGRLLAFYHRQMHEGAPAAEKYFIRTDVLYRREPEICTEPEDVEAFQLYQEAMLQAEKNECMKAQALFKRAFKKSAAFAKIYGQAT